MPKGFTLVEVLITISIVALLSAVAIPSLNNFNQGQDVSNIAADLKNLIRKAESNAQSGVNCSNKTTSIAWNIELNTNKITLSCTYDPNQPPNSEITFNPTSITYNFFCNGVPSTDPIPFNLILNSNSYNSNTIKLGSCQDTFTIKILKNNQPTNQNINITSGGSIYQ